MKSLFKFLTLSLFLAPNFIVAQDHIKIGFYNVENLFDTINDPATADDEFTPTGKKAYTSIRYNDKLTKLARAINNTKLYDADVLGLCEVENIKVLMELSKNELLRDNKYKIVHYNSPDGRGIDCALMFKSETIKILEQDSNEFTMPFAERPNTRNQLYALVYHKKRRQKMHVFVNHWPSRYGGEEQSRPKRALAAEELRNFINEKTQDDNFPIVIVGDLNDHPYNESVLNILEADTTKTNNAKPFFNTSYSWQKRGQGTHNYRGNWGVLDHIIITKKMANNNDVFQSYYSEIINNAFLLYTNKKGETSPSRSYGGPNYYGGYSDHLPVLITLYYK